MCWLYALFLSIYEHRHYQACRAIYLTQIWLEYYSIMKYGYPDEVNAP
jgi:hypothetical protein